MYDKMMNGSPLLAYGTYVPRYRLSYEVLGVALGGPGGPGARAVAAFDEDTTTMAVEAARATVGEHRPGAIYLATTSPAYFDKTNATAVHAALDLGQDGLAVDVAGSVRGATAALGAAIGTGGLAVLSDMRTGLPGSAEERRGADAAAALLFGDGEPIAEVLAEAHLTDEFLDRWRAPGERASRHWEERFGLEAYTPLIAAAVERVLSAAGVEEADHVIVTSPHARAAAAAAKRYPGRTPAVAPAIGYAGAADPGLRLAEVLDRSGPEETVLLVVAADGCDALLLKTTAALPRLRRPGPKAAAGRQVSYEQYLTWRGMLDREPPRRPQPGRPAGPPSHRSEAWKFAFVGSRCEVCGRVHVPPRRVCVECGAVDRMASAPLSANPGSVATYTVDRLAFSPSPPVIDAVVDFDGGGRYTLEVTDAGPEQVEIGTRVELTFRRLYSVEGVHNYFWKVRPSDG